MSITREQQIKALEKDWAENSRWKSVKRGYSAADVVRLRGTDHLDNTRAKRGAHKLWKLVNDEPHKVSDDVPGPVVVRLRLGADHGAPHQQYLEARR